MIFSLGYQGLTQRTLVKVLDLVQVRLLVDVRAKPFSRVPAFNRAALERSLERRYFWAGDELGGPGGGGQTTARGLDQLRQLERKHKTVAIMCMEAAPGECHRHDWIARRLLPDVDVIHIFDDELILASDLQRSIETGDDYDCEPFVGAPSREEPLLALTVRQPFASALILGHKPVENRSWAPPARLIGNRFAIHAGAKPPTAEDLASCARLGFAPDPKTLPLSALLGTMRLVECVTSHRSRWFSGPFGWVVDTPKPYAAPVPASGALKLWPCG